MTATAPAAPAKVYFTNLRTHARESQLDKLKRLIRHAGIEQIDFDYLEIQVIEEDGGE